MARRRRMFGTVEPLPSGRYRARFRPNEGAALISATTTFKTKAEASAWLALQEADLVRGVWIDARKSSSRTVEAWAEEWLSAPRKRRSTAARDRSVLRTWVLPAIGRKPLNRVTPLDVRRIVAAMQEQLAPKTVRTDYGVLRALFSAAVNAELLSRSPCRGVTLPDVPAKERPLITPAGLDCLADELGDRWRCLALLAGWLGLRWGEVVGLRVRDLDLLRRTISVLTEISEVEGRLGVELPKSKASVRTFTIPAFLVDELAAHMARFGLGAEQPEALLFTGLKGGTLRRSWVQRHFNPAVGRAGLPKAVDFHGLRHVATSYMVADNEHPRTIQQRLGHADPRLTMGLYAHVPDDVDRAAADRLDGMWRGSQSVDGTSPQAGMAE